MSTEREPARGIPASPLSFRQAFTVWFVSLFLVIMPVVIAISKACE